MRYVIVQQRATSQAGASLCGLRWGTGVMDKDTQ